MSENFISNLFTRLFIKNVINVTDKKLGQHNALVSCVQGGRHYNEDSFAMVELGGAALFVVADGLGGHGGGDLASGYFCEQLGELAKKSQSSLVTNPKEVLAELITLAAKNMGKKILAKNVKSDAHTTCVVCYVSADNIVVAHIGDSRALLATKQRMEWRTRDHSVVQMLLDDGEITEDEMGTHPDQGRLLKAISVNKCPKPTVKLYPPLEKHQALLLCTDGFWEMITPKEMQKFAQTIPVEKLINKYIPLANKRAGKDGDNVTLLVVKLND